MKINILLIITLTLISITRINGQTLYDKKFLQPSFESQETKVDSSGNAYVASWNSSGLLTLMKADASGNILWDKMFGRNDKRNIVFDMVITTHQKIVLAASFDDGGFSNYREAAVICFDTTGTLLYTKIIGDTTQVYSPNNIIADGNGYTMSMECGANGYDCVKLMTFDENGNVTKQGAIDRIDIAKVAKCPDGGYFLYESNWCFGIGKVDDNFMNESFTITVFGWTPSGFIDTEKMVSLSSKDSYVVGDFEYDTLAYDSSHGYYVTVPVYGALVGHIDSNLICDWFKIFSAPDTSLSQGHDFADFSQLPDKSWMLAGTTSFNFGSIGHPANDFFVHTDSAFNLKKFVTAAIDSEFYIDNIINSSAGFLNDKVYFTNVYTGGTMFEVIKTDTSLGGFCSPQIDTVKTFAGYLDSLNGDMTVTYYDTTRLFSSLITPFILPVSNLMPVYGDCSNIILATSQLSFTDKLSVYPNPLTSSSTLQLNTQVTNAEVVIYDMIGKELMRKKLTGSSMEIEKGSLERGVYFVRVRSDERQWVQKMIVE